jgi:acrylyl-CoA reductase (NADPH)
MSFKAVLLEERDGKVSGAVKTLEEAALPAGDVTVGIHYSTLNYKDGMILGGIGRLVRQYPHVPGVDFAGTVETSSSAKFKPGDKVVLTGWRVGEFHWGGYAQRARVKSDWLVPLPKGMTTLQAMGIGTAGFTSMLAVMALEEHGVTPESGEVLVTGAAGGVGSVAVAILAKLGYRVAASTGRPQLDSYLKDLGAETIVPRAELAEKPTKPLQADRWAGAIDAVGGNTLANALAQLKYHGSAAACGLAGGSDIPTSVIPFLLRGINLLGIDSVMCAYDRRLAAWQRLASDLPMAKLDGAIRKVPLAEVFALGPQILKGQVQGRIVVDVNG